MIKFIVFKVAKPFPNYLNISLISTSHDFTCQVFDLRTIGDTNDTNMCFYGPII